MKSIKTLTLNDGKKIELTHREFELLYYLAQHMGQVMTREHLLQTVWGYDYFGDVRTVDVTVHRLREKIEDNPRARQFLIELYPDNSEHMNVFLKLNKGYNFVGIKHNRDVYEKERKNKAGEVVNAIGELKKEHMHIIIDFENQRYLNGISKEIGLEKRFIQKVDSFKKVSRYLIHLDNEEKAQYSFDELFGSPDMIAKAKKQCTEEQTPTSVCYELLNALDNIDGIVSCLNAGETYYVYFINTKEEETKKKTEGTIKQKELKPYVYVGSKKICDCTECKFMSRRRTPDPYDWFNDDDEEYSCDQLGRVLSGMNRPYEKQPIPSDCPFREIAIGE